METREPRRAPGLTVHGVTVAFGGITALQDVSVEVAPGEVLGVIGPNGAGKTTLFNVICGFVVPQAGTIAWRGETVRRMRPHELAGRGIARTLQGVGLFAHLTVRENVMVGAERFRRAGWLSAALALPRSDRSERMVRERAAVALQRLDCADVADRLPGELPYAIQKRVALARALAGEPELLLLDEPAGGLGAEDMRELGELIRTLGREVAIMLVEHHMDVVMSVCDRVSVFDFGRVIASGAPEEIKRDIRVAEAYLGREAEAFALPRGAAVDA
ncbi:MAG TPA: ABC transporter ATP-binding protein [Solirubrobacteraceae bacterium]|nr:ABC transporter ATP-binding protein [Solirubrobacteraceae bacterium]